MVLRVIKEAQLFILPNPDEEHVLTEPNLISYTLIKLTKIGGMYAKGIEKWQKWPPQDRRKWAKFYAHMVEEYERQLTETGSTTMGQEVYVTAMHAT